MKSTKWLGHHFQSSAVKTEEFKHFANDFLADMRAGLVGTDWSIFSRSIAHFFIFGFLYNKVTGHYAYFSTADVRFCQDAWHKHLLVRRAEHATDYVGFSNMYCQLPNIAEHLTNI